jgi:hypothetical protein
MYTNLYPAYPKNKHVSYDIYIRLNSICSNQWSPFLCFISCPCPLHFYYIFCDFCMTFRNFLSQIYFLIHVTYFNPLTVLYLLSFSLNFLHYTTSSFVYSFFPLFCTLFHTHRLFDPWFLLWSEEVPRGGTGITVGICATSQTEWLERVGLYRSFDFLAAVMTYHATSDRVHFCTAGHKAFFYIS